jgi:hypothetical protein
MQSANLASSTMDGYILLQPRKMFITEKRLLIKVHSVDILKIYDKKNSPSSQVSLSQM